MKNKRTKCRVEGCNHITAYKGKNSTGIKKYRKVCQFHKRKLSIIIK